MGIASKEYFMWSFSKIILTYRTVVNKLDHLASKPTAHQSSKLRRKEGFSHRLRTKEEKVFLKFTYESKKSLWKHLLGEREDSLVIRMPRKYSRTTLGGLQSGFICILCQHEPSEVSRTAYLRGIWRFVRVPWLMLLLDLNRTIWLWDHLVVHHLLSLHTRPGQSAAQCSWDGIVNQLFQLYFRTVSV